MAKVQPLHNRNLIISKMECDQETMKEMQKEIDKFVIRANHSWISRDRLYQRPEDGGLGAIHIETHANALRCAWAKRATKGLWANGLLMKVNEPKNICFISEDDIHPMHKGIKMICRAFEALHNSYRDEKSETKFHTPYKYLDVIKTNGPRGGKLKMSKPTIHSAPFLFNSRGFCELS